MADITAGYPLTVVILVYLQLYFSQFWYALFPAMAFGTYFGGMKLFTFPLHTRNPVELVVIFKPSRAIVLKVTDKSLPYFTHKNQLYWFGEPHTVGNNLLHLYFSGVNQPITHLDRVATKESDIITLREFTKQVTGHNIRIPAGRRAFIRNWVLIIKNGEVKLQTLKESGLKGRQRYKINVLTRIGLYMTQEIEAESTNTSANARLQSVTIQTIQQKIGDKVRGTNFSSRLAYKIIKRARYVEINWVRLLTGGFDWKIIMFLLLIVIGAVGVYFLYQSSQ